MECLFCKIANKKIETHLLYEDRNVVAFADIHPIKPVHILIIPKKHIEDVLHLNDDTIWISIRKAVQEIVHKHRLEKKGFKISINGGGSQDINHLHVHVMGPINN